MIKVEARSRAMVAVLAGSAVHEMPLLDALDLAEALVGAVREAKNLAIKQFYSEGAGDTNGSKNSTGGAAKARTG